MEGGEACPERRRRESVHRLKTPPYRGSFFAPGFSQGQKIANIPKLKNPASVSNAGRVVFFTKSPEKF